MLKGINFLIAYSVKANSNLSVLKTFAKYGAGADVVSIGELKKHLKQVSLTIKLYIQE